MTGKYLILIADDQPHILLALEHLVQDIDDVCVITANDGAHAVNKALNRKPHLAVLSTRLPQIDGILAARMIRDQWDEQGHAGQIWLSAGNLDTPNAVDLSACGAHHVLTHPFDPVLVVEQINQALQTQTAA